MNERFDGLPPTPQPEQEESIIKKLLSLGGPENPEFLAVFGEWLDKQIVIAEANNTPQANIELLLATAKLKAELGLSEAALDDLNDVLEQIYETADYSDLGAEANHLMKTLERQKNTTK